MGKRGTGVKGKGERVKGRVKGETSSSSLPLPVTLFPLFPSSPVLPHVVYEPRGDGWFWLRAD